MRKLDPLMLYRRLEVLRQCRNKGHTYLDTGGVSSYRSYAELVRDARRIQSHLVRRGFKAGDRLALVATDARNFIPAFLGGVLAGVILVPVSPPPVSGRGSAYATLMKQIAQVADISGIVAPLSLQPVVKQILESAALLAYEELQTDIEPLPTAQELAPESICFLQFTSGSTGDPKGVVVTYKNLAANCRAIMQHGMRITDTDVGVSWLPLYHDMGLIGKVLAPLTYPTDMVYLSTSAFIKNPNLWLETISRFKGTISFGPNFAFAHVAKHFKRRPKELSLGSLRVLGCGAEPINPDVLKDFTSTFERYGLRRDAIMPSYGMAEATLAVSFSLSWRELVIDRQASEAQRKTLLVSTGEPVSSARIRLVSCGRALPDHEIAIIDERGDHLPNGHVGEIAVRGPSVTGEYFRNPGATSTTFVDGWLKTGDLGLLVEDELYVCGRVKDLIIVNGRNYYPQDIEWVVEQLPGVRPGSIVACAVPGHETEHVVVLAEVRKQETRPNLDAEIRRLVMDELSIMVHDAVLLTPGSIPKTSSGKVQRAKARENYLRGFYGEAAAAS